MRRFAASNSKYHPVKASNKKAGKDDEPSDQPLNK